MLNKDSFSFRIHILIKLGFICFLIYSLSSNILSIQLGTSLIIASFLIKGEIRKNWLKVVSKASIMLITYLVFQFIFKQDLELALFTTARLILYIVLIVWLKNTTTIKSYLSDLDKALDTIRFAKLKSNIRKYLYVFNYFIISTILNVENFYKYFSHFSKDNIPLKNRIMQVLFKSMADQNYIKRETEETINIIYYRKFYWLENILVLLLIASIILINNQSFQEYAKIFN